MEVEGSSNPHRRCSMLHMYDHKPGIRADGRCLLHRMGRGKGTRGGAARHARLPGHGAQRAARARPALRGWLRGSKALAARKAKAHLTVRPGNPGQPGTVRLRCAEALARQDDDVRCIPGKGSCMGFV